jgi:hypothetical protein
MLFSHDEVQALSDAVLKIAGMVRREEPISEDYWGTLLDVVYALRDLAPPPWREKRRRKGRRGRQLMDWNHDGHTRH